MEKRDAINVLSAFSVKNYKERKTREGVSYECDVLYKGDVVGSFYNDGDGGPDTLEVRRSLVDTLDLIAEDIFVGFSLSEKASLLVHILIDSVTFGGSLEDNVNMYLDNYSEFKFA